MLMTMRMMIGEQTPFYQGQIYIYMYMKLRLVSLL